MKKIVYLVFLFVLSFFVSKALAASFNPLVTPNTTNAGASNVLLNFSIANADTKNITRVSITLPSGFSYGSDAGTTVDTSKGLFSPPPDGPFWYNITSIGIIYAITTQYFWFRVNSPSSTGIFNFNISTLDVDNTFNSQNVSVTVTDQTAPQWSGNLTTPVSPVKYSPGQSYMFNITWIDNVAIDEVKFEWNGANYTNTTSPAVISLGSNKYGITLTDLAASNNTYKWYASDTSIRWNSTLVFVYNVTSATNLINIYFNGNLNQNFLIADGTTLNTTATSTCTQTGCSVYLYKNDSSVTNPYIDVLPRGTYKFKSNATGNANYSTNSTGAIYFLNVIYSPPKYSVSTSIPSSYSPTTHTTFNIAWADENDPNGFNVSIIEGNWSGSLTNYTMSRVSGTNTSTYSVNLPAGNFLWRVYANNSFNSFNSTSQSSFTIEKAIPTFILRSIPSWSVSKGTQTTVNCTSGQVLVNLYRNNSLVSNPDVQTLAVGSYIYKCNNTATINYTSNSTSNTLIVSAYAVNLEFTKAGDLILLEQNSFNSTIVQVKNTGNITQDINFTIENISSAWYTVDATNATLATGRTATFLVNFSVGAPEIKNYPGKFKASSPNITITSNFTLRVLPNEANRIMISNSLAANKTKMIELEKDINQTKAKGLNVSAAEEKLNELKAKVEEGENYIANGDYFSAYFILGEIKTLVDDITSELSKFKPEERKNILIYIVIGICVVTVVILVYLFWPMKLPPKIPYYEPEVKEKIWFRLKRKLSELFRKRYRYKRP